MSYIDSYAHEFVGYFAGRPIYHPLEDISGTSNDIHDFACTTRQLVVGGGGGEYPALVIKEPASAVAQFIDHCEQFTLDDDQSFALIDMSRTDHMLDFAGWDSRDHHAFYTTCIGDALPSPFQDDQGLSFEDWIGCSFGEFIFSAMPDLTPDLVATFSPLRTENPHPTYNNMLLMPPGLTPFANGGNAFVSERRKK